MIYEPREDSYLLEKYVKKYATGRVLDMGTGSGVLALAALEKTKNVLATDVNLDAVKKAREKGVNAIKSDLFEKVIGKFDLIIFNPPYLPEEKLEDEETKKIVCGGKKGNEILERFLSEVGNYLKLNGKILIVVSTLTPDVDKLIRKYGFKFRILEKKKIFYEKLVVYLIEKVL